MPKLKTNRGAAKRFRKTATGKFKHRRAFRNHILTKKANGRMRKLRAQGLSALAEIPMIARLLKLK